LNLLGLTGLPSFWAGRRRIRHAVSPWGDSRRVSTIEILRDYPQDDNFRANP